MSGWEDGSRAKVLVAVGTLPSYVNKLIGRGEASSGSPMLETIIPDAPNGSTMSGEMD